MVADAGLEGVDELPEKLGGDMIPDFIRRLVGLDEAAVRAELADLLHGSLEMPKLFKEPFTAYGNLLDLFGGNQAIVLALKERLDRINRTVSVGAG